MRWLAWLAAPSVFLLTKATELVLRHAGREHRGEEDANEDEIRGSIQKGGQSAAPRRRKPRSVFIAFSGWRIAR